MPTGAVALLCMAAARAVTATFPVIPGARSLAFDELVGTFVDTLSLVAQDNVADESSLSTFVEVPRETSWLQTSR